MKVSIISVAYRPKGLDMLYKCLKRQTFKDFEWIIVSPDDSVLSIEPEGLNVVRLKDPPKPKGNYYNLHKCWNYAIKKAKGELLISIVDLTWIEPDCIERLWGHYQINPKSCVTCVGDQYKEVINGKPEKVVWTDPRKRSDLGTFYECLASDMELCVASFPKEGIYEIGGFDEIYDEGVAIGEKEAMTRMYIAGYNLYLDQSNEYRAVWHPRIKEDHVHEENYKKNSKVFVKHMKDNEMGRRLKVNYL